MAAISPVRKKRRSRQTIMCEVLEELLPDYPAVRDGYYSFLISPKGEPMQLDLYFPTLGLAFEYQGKQHYRRSKYLGQSQQQFEYLKMCDALKKRLCEAAGITLVAIRYDWPLTPENLVDKIKKANPELGRKLFNGRYSNKVKKKRKNGNNA